jgi:DNA/RNA-binding domain of Phe-tRNA-synthetase-like protein
MNSEQYEELCRFFIADQLQIPRSDILSPYIPMPCRRGGPGYFHQIDLYWSAANSLTRYINIANAKWRGRLKVGQADVLLLLKVKEKVAAHKALMITNTCYSSRAKVVADDEGVGLLIVRPAFDTSQLHPHDRAAMAVQFEVLAKSAGRVYTYYIEGKGPQEAQPPSLRVEGQGTYRRNHPFAGVVMGQIRDAPVCPARPNGPWPFPTGGSAAILELHSRPELGNGVDRAGAVDSAMSPGKVDRYGGESTKVGIGKRQDTKDTKVRKARKESASSPSARERITAMLTVDPHPLLDLRAFVTAFPRPLGEMASPAELVAMLAIDAPAPMRSDDQVRETVRQLLRHGGFKPTGRSKPASEYLIRAVGEGKLTSLNVAVDVCNIVSLHSGLPISVVDLDRAREPFRVAIAPKETTYVFNASGQTIDVGGLLCFFDAEGPCANAVKDAQRTKTTGNTRRTLSIVWGRRSFPAEPHRRRPGIGSC